ncbi:aminoacyl-tRNA hydrolase [bacterium]|nr:aminoacyl-tRNA hydrolase [bacterium]
MKLIVGLGNPGSKYALNRHNIGFMALDAFAIGAGVTESQWKNEHKALTFKMRLGSESFLLSKPQTFMNLSGESVAPLMNYYNITLDELLIVHDEVDLPYGKMKFQRRRSPGGNNGIKSTHQHLGTDDYCRLRVGVGRPSNSKMSVADWVLQDFSKEEMKLMPDYLEVIGDAIESFVTMGFEKSATAFNSRQLEGT